MQSPGRNVCRGASHRKAFHLQVQVDRRVIPSMEATVVVVTSQGRVEMEIGRSSLIARSTLLTTAFTSDEPSQPDLSRPPATVAGMDPTPPPSPFVTVDSPDDVDALAESLRAPTGALPTLVVTGDRDDGLVQFDLPRIARDAGNSARLVVITDGSLTYRLKDLMPPDTVPFNGAARVYPVHDRSWMTRPHDGSLFFLTPRAGTSDEWTGRLVRTLLAVAENDRGAADLDAFEERQKAEHTTGEPQPFRGEFTGAASATEGIISSPDAPRLGMLRVELDTVAPGMPVDIGSIFTSGDEVSGHFDTTGAVVDVDGVRTAADMADDLVRQHCYPARVTQVLGKSQVKVQIVPGVESHLTQTDIGASEPGDLVVVQVQSVRSRNGKLKIAVGPAPETDGNVEPAPVLRTGGPAWLTVGTVEVIPDTEEDATGDVPAGSVAELEGLRRNVPRLKAEMERLREDISRQKALVDRIRSEATHAWDDCDRLTDENEGLRLFLQNQGITVPTTLPGAGPAVASRRTPRAEITVEHQERIFLGNEFEDPAEQLDLEIRVAWAQQVDASDKKDHRLRFTFGDGFLASVDKTIRDGESLRWKLPQTLAWAASGYEERLTEQHAYRTSNASGSPQRIRSRDRAKAYRANLETNTAAARRLHYYRLPDGTVEFHSVNTHDDFPAM